MWKISSKHSLWEWCNDWVKSQRKILTTKEMKAVRRKKLLEALRNRFLVLDIDNIVVDDRAAHLRGAMWEKKLFWYVTDDKKTIRTLDFRKKWAPVLKDYTVGKTKFIFKNLDLLW